MKIIEEYTNMLFKACRQPVSPRISESMKWQKLVVTYSKAGAVTKIMKHQETFRVRRWRMEEKKH
ncbi:hypothetical protein MASR2M79_15730 [Aminivibrio sp.]